MPSPFRDRCILHLDADAFFASLEQRDDPKLRGKPVAVGTGVVASCSYEAKQRGVTTGMRLAEARQRCRGLIVVPGEYPRYEQAARRVQAICEERTPAVEAAALDDLYLDLTQRVGDPSAAGSVAGELRQAIRDEVRLSVSIGVGSNKLVSRVATREAKQRRLRTPEGQSAIALVGLGGERDYLAPWPARVLPGAGGRLGERLERLNVQRVGEVADMPVALLRGLFGANRGAVLHAQAHGIDPRPVEPHRPQQSVGRRTSFDPPAAELTFLRAMLAYLLERACCWLRFNGLAARGLVVTIRYGDYVSAVGRESFRQPADDEVLLQEAALERFGRLYQRRLPLRFLGVELAPLVARRQEVTLFDAAEEEKRQRLLEVKDAVRRRFGFTSLLTGASLLLADRLERDRENFKMRTPCLTR
jgi:DNA polymerase-4